MADTSGGAAVATSAAEQRAQGATLAEEFREGDFYLNALIASDNSPLASLLPSLTHHWRHMFHVSQLDLRTEPKRNTSAR